MSLKPSASGLSSWQVRKILHHIEANLADEVPVTRLAELLGLSEGYFARAFRAALGTPPHAFLVDRRLARAMSLMRRSSRGLSEIALECGFSDQPHLTKSFRRRVGTSPGAWRKAQAAGQLRAPSSSRRACQGGGALPLQGPSS